MNNFLDRIYRVSGAVAALFILLICLTVTLQVVLNLTTKILGANYAYTLPSYADFAGYFLAASSFLALAYTITRDGHIRVTLVLHLLPKTVQFISNIFTMLVCTALALFSAYYMVLQTIESHSYGDMSSGIVPIPIWIPQTAVCLGLCILSIALIDLTFRLLTTREISFTQSHHSEDI